MSTPATEQAATTAAAKASAARQRAAGRAAKRGSSRVVGGTGRQVLLRRIGLYIVLTVVGLALFFPFLIVAGSSLKARDDIFRYPPRLLPYAQDTAEVGGDEVPLYLIDGEERALVDNVGGGQGLFVLPEDPTDEVTANIRTAPTVDSVTARPENFTEVLDQQNLNRSLTNTVLVTILIVGGTVLTSILGGYAFARINFPGRDALFLIYIGSIMVPFVILIVPLYQVMVFLGWVDSLASLVFPFIFNAYGTFLIRQFFVSIPKELEEAATIDGASRWTILWRIFVPLSTPAIATLATFMFLYAWNSFVWPFIVINAGNTDNHVLTLSLQQLGGRAADTPNLIFAAVIIAISVPVTVFVLAQRYFVENLASSGIK